MDFKDTIINIQKILCDLRTRIDNITNTPVTVTTGRGENYTYLDLTSNDTAVNTITLQTEINRVANLTPYGLQLSDTNRFTIYATGKVNTVIPFPFLNLDGGLGKLKTTSLESLDNNSLKNIICNNLYDVDNLPNTNIEDCEFYNGLFVDSNCLNTTFKNTNFYSAVYIYNSLNLQMDNCFVVGLLALLGGTNAKLHNTVCSENVGLNDLINVKITNCHFKGLINQFFNSQGLIYNSILNPADITLPLKMRGCLDLNNDPINDNEFYKNIYSNTTLDNSHNNSIIFVKNSVTITLPVNLAIDFNCIVKCLSGCTATYIAGIGATISTESTGVLQLERTPSSITKDGINNYVLTGTT